MAKTEFKGYIFNCDRCRAVKYELQDYLPTNWREVKFMGAEEMQTRLLCIQCRGKFLNFLQGDLRAQ